MKKLTFTVLSSVVAASMIASVAAAAPKEGKGHSQGASSQKQESKKEARGAEKDKQVKVKLKDEAAATVTGVTYGEEGKGKGKGKVPPGLQRAYEKNKDKPSGAVLGALLEKYGKEVQGSAELTSLAAELAEQGDAATAVEVQKEALKADLKNLQLYKKLAQLQKKLGQADGIKAFVNGEEPKFEVAPFIKDGSTLVPFRAIAESLQAEVAWNAEERSVTVTRGDTVVKLFIGSTTAVVNGEEVALEVAAQIENGSTVIPVRFVSESLKADVQWEPESQSVVIVDETAAATEETAADAAADTTDATTETTTETTTDASAVSGEAAVSTDAAADTAAETTTDTDASAAVDTDTAVQS
ncbi:MULTISPECIES: copper amine oxidase N-terminal domain-containing protein [Paenibacillus]|uniref:copper amine oxidase N-terminal domain-containing protein n=1 Tax=Paenibacillus TaxID=44249 RepID=UPI0022B911FE|nr:copper amine oxidase N-terminal domain-containing protein [Paenibacillus caseinilyticus]MCZ8519135.1 copper amine oxidase N-terminal domain-containing protein [Paenibacillus caseinilyticus]